MHLVTLTPFLSRNAGGLFPLIRGLNQALLSEDLAIDVLGMADVYSAEDGDSWQPLKLQAFATKGPKSFSYAPGMASALRQLKPDIVHSHGLWLYHSYLNHGWSTKRALPYLISPQGMLDPWALRNVSWKKRLAAKIYEDRHLRGATCLHAVSVAEAEAIRAYGLRNPIALIPNAIELPTPSGKQVPSPWPEDFQDGQQVMLFLGRLHPKKGLVPLINAWALLQQELPEKAGGWRLAIAGWDENNHRAALEQQVAELNLADRIHFCGPLHGAAKEAAFRHADAFVLSSFSEGMPAAVLEAMAYELPVLMSPACNFPEGFAAGAALSVDPTTESVAAGLRAFLQLPPEEQLAMGRRGYTLVSEQFTWSTLAPRMRAVYEWALGGGPDPADLQRV
ncbi:MAG: glycosyltransferase [Prochlorococcaceae cyanobacterium]